MMMHVTMENFNREESRGNRSNRNVVQSMIPMVPVLDLQQQKKASSDIMDGGRNTGGNFVLLSSTSLCKSLKMVEPIVPSSSMQLEHVGDDRTVCSDNPEVTWAVQVLDKLITLAKQWHIVTNPASYKGTGRQSIFDSKAAAPKEPRSELQMQLFENTPTELSSQELVQDTDDMKRPSLLEHANHEAVMQETELGDDATEQTPSLGCLEEVKIHDNMECEQAGKLQETTIQEPAIKQEQCHAQMPDDVCSQQLLLEDIRAEFERYPPQSLEEFEVHEDVHLLEEEPQIVLAQLVHHETPTKENRELASQHLYPSPCSFTYEDSSPVSVLSKEDQRTSKPLKRLFVEIIPQEDHQSSREFYDSNLPSWSRTELEYPCGSAFIYRDSPTSTLSAEPDEQPHLTEVSDSSEQNELRCPCSSTFVYRDESSDSESFEDDPHEQLQVMKATVTAVTTAQCLRSPSKKLPVIHDFGLDFNKDSNLGYGSQPAKGKSGGYDMPEQIEIQAEGGPEPPYSPGFAYTDSPVSVLPKLVSTEEYQTSETATSSTDVDLPELQLFHQASNWEPWLQQRDGDSALDEEDLQFLFPPSNDANARDIIFSEEVVFWGRQRHESSCSPTPELQNQLQWGGPSSSELGGRSRGHQESLSRWHSSKFDDDDDKEIFPSFKSWEIQEEEKEAEGGATPKKTTTRRRSHRKLVPQQGQKKITISSVIASHRSQLTSLVPSASIKQQRSSSSNAEFVPCSGRLFSWPGRMLMFSPGSSSNSSKAVTRFNKDSSGFRGSVNNNVMETSFGGSAKRDAQQVRSILIDSRRKNPASVTVADILRGDHPC